MIAVLSAPKIRLHDWQIRFSDLVRDRMNAPFVWGSHDCCLWASDCVLALTGVDPAGELRGKYASEREAVRLVASLGGMADIASDALGPPVRASMASIGDIVLITHERRTLLAVCNGGTLLAPAAHGLKAHPMQLTCKSWKV